MSGLVTMLVTLYDGSQLMRIAVQFEAETVDQECILYPMEKTSRDTFWRMLPEHMREIGGVVHAEQIHDVFIDPVRNVRNFM